MIGIRKFPISGSVNSELIRKLVTKNYFELTRSASPLLIRIFRVALDHELFVSTVEKESTMVGR
jgi:hypothetical protein